ncbi:glycosyltransferase family 2 protein [Thiobacillus sp.]|uniref:glycosyltransferase family 2 protein n=1 Tax=Thiobacillus sp. TaxID=924 RepID=UPI0025D795EF|nr:glycosyltransferase family 2 protein [Thiobacillus sp.]MBT9539917.1 glycosyltransferase family 2 protein [Thiobacillus sp.]
MPPSVSIIIPAYNAEAFIAATLDSVLAQTVAPAEIIVINDGSTDTTPELLSAYGSRIQVFHQQNAGQAAARNTGARLSRGDLLLFLDSDDLLDPDFLAQQGALLTRFDGADAVYCDHRTIDETGQITAMTGALGYPRPSGDILRALLHGPCIVTPGLVLLRRAAFEATCGFNQTTAMRGYEDDALWLEMAARGSFIYNPHTLLSYRRHAAQATRQSAYQLKAGLARLTALQAIAAAVTARAQPELQHFYQTRLRDSRLSAAWANGQLGNHAAALHAACAALANHPASAQAWRGFGHALFRAISSRGS